jgi:hypothetical protein
MCRIDKFMKKGGVNMTKYESPIIVPLGETAKGSGLPGIDCSAGSAAPNACTAGPIAVTGGCTAGGTDALGHCTAGATPT